MTDRRVALLAQAAGYVGPDPARLLAADGHDLVLGNAVVTMSGADLAPDHDPEHAASSSTHSRWG